MTCVCHPGGNGTIGSEWESAFRVLSIGNSLEYHGESGFRVLSTPVVIGRSARSERVRFVCFPSFSREDTTTERIICSGSVSIKSIRSKQYVVLYLYIELDTTSIGGPFDDITETIFADKAVLTESYQPETILERDEEIKAYSHALQDVLFGRTPENVFVYGKAGVGKTAVTKYMLEELREEVPTREAADELHTYTVNCNGRTLFILVRSLVDGLLPEHASRFPERGLGTGDAFDELYRQFDRIDRTHLVVFDEIDHLEDANTLLYELPRARANGHITDATVGVIGISNDYTFRQILSPKVKDTLMETEIT